MSARATQKNYEKETATTSPDYHTDSSVPITVLTLPTRSRAGCFAIRGSFFNPLKSAIGAFYGNSIKRWKRLCNLFG